MRFLPVFLDLSKGQVILVGSGAQAIAKLQLLRSAARTCAGSRPTLMSREQLSLRPTTQVRSASRSDDPTRPISPMRSRSFQRRGRNSTSGSRQKRAA